MKVPITADSTLKGFPSQPVTLGDHIRKARLNAGLWHKHLAEVIGVNTCTINNWENGHGEPEARYIPAIIEFLGYNPKPCPTGILDRLRWYKWSNGMSFERLGEAMGKDPEQLMDWMSGRHKPFKKSLNKIEAFLNCHTPGATSRLDCLPTEAI